MKNTIKKLSLLALTLTMSISIVACGSSGKYEPVEVPKDTKEPVQVEDYTNDLKEEKEVTDGNVYIENDTVIATMVINKDVSDKEAKELAEKYAKDLKATYKDKKVNVQAVKDGKNIATIELE